MADCGWAWGAQFGDLDDDGFQDLVVVNGFISASRERDYWYQMSKISLATGDVVADAALWPALEDRSLSGYERTRLLRNLGRPSARFEEVGAAAGLLDRYDGRAVALADLDARRAARGPRSSRTRTVRCWSTANESDGPTGSGSRFDLRRHDGATATRWAPRSVLEYFSAGARQEPAPASSPTACGFASQNQRRLAHFGHRRRATRTLRASVRWPSGERRPCSESSRARAGAPGRRARGARGDPVVAETHAAAPASPFEKLTKAVLRPTPKNLITLLITLILVVGEWTYGDRRRVREARAHARHLRRRPSSCSSWLPARARRRSCRARTSPASA